MLKMAWKKPGHFFAKRECYYIAVLRNYNHFRRNTYPIKCKKQFFDIIRIRQL